MITQIVTFVQVWSKMVEGSRWRSSLNTHELKISVDRAAQYCPIDPNSNKLRQRNGSALTTAWRSMRNCLHLCKHSFSKQSLQMLRVDSECLNLFQSQQFKYFSSFHLAYWNIWNSNWFILVFYNGFLRVCQVPGLETLLPEKETVESLEMEKVRFQNPFASDGLEILDCWWYLNHFEYTIHIYNIYTLCIYNIYILYLNILDDCCASFIVFPNPDPTAGLDSLQDTGGIDFQTLVGGHTLSRSQISQILAQPTPLIRSALQCAQLQLRRAMSRFFVLCFFVKQPSC